MGKGQRKDEIKEEGNWKERQEIRRPAQTPLKSLTNVLRYELFINSEIKKPSKLIHYSSRTGRRRGLEIFEEPSEDLQQEICQDKELQQNHRQQAGQEGSLRGERQVSPPVTRYVETYFKRSNFPLVLQVATSTRPPAGRQALAQTRAPPCPPTTPSTTAVPRSVPAQSHQDLVTNPLLLCRSKRPALCQKKLSAMMTSPPLKTARICSNRSLNLQTVSLCVRCRVVVRSCVCRLSD